MGILDKKNHSIIQSYGGFCKVIQKCQTKCGEFINQYITLIITPESENNRSPDEDMPPSYSFHFSEEDLPPTYSNVSNLSLPTYQNVIEMSNNKL